MHDSMAPSASPRRSPCAAARRRLRRNRNARTPLVGGSATARALAAGLWRLRHDGPPSSRQGRQGIICTGKKTRNDLLHCSICRRNHGILDKMELEACVALPSGSMEKATKWDRVYVNNLGLDVHLEHGHARAMAAVALESELEKARAQIVELEEERRATRKKVDRFVRKVVEEKASWKSRVAALKEEARMERRHRRLLEAANGKLMGEAAAAKASAKQAAQRCEMERKARELMEEACSELAKEVEEDQAEVAALRAECVAMREEMEEERRMLQMAEVWREERVQMKLSDAKLALEHKYAHLNRLQSDMEAFLRRGAAAPALREARIISDAANSVSLHDVDELCYRDQHQHSAEDVDVELVFDHFRRKENGYGGRSATASASPASNVQSVSPATDIFLAKLDDDDNGSDSGWAWDDDHRRRDSHSCASSGGTSEQPSVGGNNGSGVGVTSTSDAHSRQPGKSTALIRRLWRSAISESRKKAGSGTSKAQQQMQWTEQKARQPSSPLHKQSLKEKLMEAGAGQRQATQTKTAYKLVSL